MKSKFYLLFLFTVLSINALAQTTYYVNYGTGSDTNPGTSWASPFRNLTKALAAAQASSAAEVDVWVAAGTYTPIDGVATLPADHRDTSFSFYRGTGVGMALKVYGGFAGTETSITQRDTLHVTYLEGIIGANNSFHIGVIAGLAATADSVVIDGFTFRDGNAATTGTKTFNGVAINRFDGGGLAIVQNGSPKLALRNCTFFGNNIMSSANEAFGGGVYINNSGAFVHKCKFNYNAIVSNYYSLVTCNVYGGALYARNGQIVLSRCAFNGNSATIDGNSGYSSAGGAVYFESCTTPLISHCYFSTNKATNTMAGATIYGGALANSNSNSIILGCTFANNFVSDHYFPSSSTPYYPDLGAGAIFNRACTVRIDSSNFMGNQANHDAGGNTHGGAIFDSMATVLITNDSFSTNTCTGGDSRGGALCSNFSTDTVYNCNFNNNNANGGGAIDNTNGATMHITKCDLGVNSANFGGALLNDNNAMLYMRSTVLHDNSSAGDGGCVRAENSDIHLSNCQIVGSYAGGSGGGLYIRIVTSGIDSCTFDRNSSNGAGAGVCVADNTSFAPVHCVFKGNWASPGDGGAIYFTGGSATSAVYLNLNGNVFLYNKATYGGALSVNYSATYLTGADTIINNVFLGNNASTKGGAYFGGASTHFVCNNTFVKDSANWGGAVATLGTTVYMQLANNIFDSCYAPLNPTGDTSLVGTGLYYIYQNIFSGTDPMFVNPSNPVGPDNTWGTNDDGFILQHCGPAVNTGSNMYVMLNEPFDIHHIARIYAGAVDIGAYETVTIGPVTGLDTMCVGSTTTLTDTTIGGTWTSTVTTVATVSATGIVTAVAPGYTHVNYSHTGACGTDLAAHGLWVVAAPSGVLGADSVCAMASITLSDSTSGGSWTSSSTGTATVTGTGTVTGVAGGTATISYHVGNACGVYDRLHTVTVKPLPTAATITGTDTVCQGAQVTVTSSATGGTWSTLHGYATSDASGTITGVNPGIDIINYTLTNSCGSTASVFSIHVFSTGYCDSMTIVSSPTMGGASLSIYPDPAHGAITVALTGNTTSPVMVNMTNLLGLGVRSSTLNSGNNATLNIDGLPAGVYLITVTNGGDRLTRRVIVE